MWDWFVNGIFEVLHYIQQGVGDWGLAIIILTILFRLLLWPLTLKQVKSTYELQKIQPKIKEIQNKYADDKEKQQEELMKFYSEHKVNPFASCLPMLLQMPIFIALYTALGPKGPMAAYLSADGASGSFFGIIPNIMHSASTVFADGGIIQAIPYVIVLLLFGLSMWIPQLMMPGEKSQKMVGAYMAVFMLFIGWTTPAGVLLYWDTSSLLGIAQQYITQKALGRAAAEEEIVVESKKTKKSSKKG